MKKLLSLFVCLLLITSLALPVLATEAHWEASIDTEETYSEEESEQVYIQWITGEEFDGAIQVAPVDPDKFQIITATPEEWEIGAVDGQEIITYGSVIPPESAYASSPVPSAVLLIILIVLALLLAFALFVALVILVIVLIVRSNRKKKENNE